MNKIFMLSILSVFLVSPLHAEECTVYTTDDGKRIEICYDENGKVISLKQTDVKK